MMHSKVGTAVGTLSGPRPASRGGGNSTVMPDCRAKKFQGLRAGYRRTGGGPRGRGPSHLPPAAALENDLLGRAAAADDIIAGLLFMAWMRGSEVARACSIPRYTTRSRAR